ncbi:beta-glucosidase [Penicillium hetheringtonii]|uniref:Beta-glucosidase n=1 Tax=Penicillium hetheringtonii TaxID=911720 RepID=A0AAD6DPU7_9EURO|nr:beta-glucosidase [Penicillium hetheringtonii]
MPERADYNGVARTDLTTQACDMCRKRKVKCLLPSPENAALSSRCQRCERLNILCTFNSPSKPRGPKRRTEANARSQEPPPDVRYRTDDLCNRGLFKILMQDYLDRLYPLVPIVHRPSFREALRKDQDCEDEGFYAVTLGIAALVVATLASNFSVYKSHAQPLQLSSRKEFVHSCYKKAVLMRSWSYFDQLNFQKFAVSYLFSAAFLQLGDQNWSRMLSVEAMQIARLLKMHLITNYEGLNCIETQLRKKGFWLVFYIYV